MLRNKEIIESEYRQLNINFSLQEFANWILAVNEYNNIEATQQLFRLYWRIIRKKKGQYHSEFLRLFPRLIRADTYSAANIDFKLKNNFIEANDLDEYFKTISKPSPLNTIREKIRLKALETLAQSDIEKTKVYFVNSFTGSGKTLTSLAVALKLKEMKKAVFNTDDVKMIYGLPFINIIIQTYDIFKDVLRGNIQDFDKYESHYLLQHFYLSDNVYHDKDRKNTEFIENKTIIDNFESSLVVTTFVQLFNAFFTNKNTNLSKLTNMRDSIIILDEAQNFDVEYWGIVEKIIEFWADTLNIHFILMTATKPVLFEDKSISLVEAGFNVLPKPRIRLYYDNTPRTVEEFADYFIKNDYSKNSIDSYLFVLNTIKSSKQLFQLLNKEIENACLIYLSNNITSVEKGLRLEKAKKELENGNKVIVVSTQVIEAGVDISFSRVYRDFASLDSILQCGGRANRHAVSNIADVIVVKLISETNRPYADFIYGDIHIDQTEKVLKNALENKQYLTDRDDFDSLINEYFKGIKKRYRFLLDDKAHRLWEAYTEFEADKIKEFSLIEDSEKVTLFLEINDEAKKIWSKYKEKVVNEKDYRKKQNELLKIRGNFSKYIINIYETRIDNLQLSRFQSAINKHSKNDQGVIGDILCVPSDVVAKVYDSGSDMIDQNMNICCDGVGLL